MEKKKSVKSVAEKMGVKENSRAIFIQAHQEAVEGLGLPTLDIDTALQGAFDYIHLFVKRQSEFITQFPRLKSHLKPTGMVWVSWPKGRRLGTDLSLPVVIKLGYEHGLVESTCLSVNETWSGLKFTHPKEGKVYQNSYGKLKV